MALILATARAPVKQFDSDETTWEPDSEATERKSSQYMNHNDRRYIKGDNIISQKYP
jgi:hypothetical protein